MIKFTHPYMPHIIQEFFSAKILYTQGDIKRLFRHVAPKKKELSSPNYHFVITYQESEIPFVSEVIKGLKENSLPVGIGYSASVLIVGAWFSGLKKYSNVKKT